METKDIILELRTKNGLSQEELAIKNNGHKTGCIPLGKW